MAIVFDKANSNIISGVSTDTGTVTVPAGGIAAGTLVVAAGCNWDGAATLNSVSDTRGNTYSTPIVEASGADVASGVAYSIIDTALQAGDTISAVWSIDEFAVLITGIVSYTGIAALTPLDQHNEGAGTGTTLASGNITTTQADELLLGIGALADNTTWTKTASFDNARISASHTDFLAMIVEDRIVAATGTYASGPSSTSSDLWTSQIVSFEAAAAAGDTTTRRYQIRRSRMTSW